MTVPCDKLSDHMFNYTPAQYKDIILNHENCDCIEGEDHKGKEVCTPYWLELSKDYVDLSPLTPFDREVLFHAISAFEQGFRVISISMTLDSLTGGEEKRNVRKNQYEAIKASIHKLMKTVITIDLEPLLKAFPKYRKRYIGKAELTSSLLPCRYLDAEINGQKTLAVELFEESPLMTVAKLKKQVLTYDNEPLAIPNQNHTPQVIAIDNYLLRRVHLIKRGMNPSILLETVYRYCGIENATKWQKQDARKIIDDTLNHFKAEGIIKNFTWKKQEGEYRSIAIETEPRPKNTKK